MARKGENEVDILNGIKVVDVTAWAFVPSAGGVLAHWGADVIKVESPEAPDPMRLLGGTLEPGASSAAFKHYSRGKRSIAIDLASDEGRELLYRLVARADVFLTSYLAPTRRKLGIDVADTQLDKFKGAARQLETDDEELRFKERLGKLVKHKPVEKPDA